MPTMFVKTKREDQAEETNDFGEPLPNPLCGCCRGPVEIRRIEGEPYTAGARRHVPVVYEVVWKCPCQELLKAAKCILCNRCPGCCRCRVPALEAQ